jgi:hypothetical protein
MKTYALRALPAGGWTIFANGSAKPVILVEDSKDLAIFKATLAPAYGPPTPQNRGSEVQWAGDASA